ncbi:MAG TPA: carboxypeptidase regulatory-like domain-containing protein, partial [candidate division Zixibacteria bacterium]|nr:carboxypeptidase regulatory-like domain-containing protein [candidate division Zixibacteria bacterium]
MSIKLDKNGCRIVKSCIFISLVLLTAIMMSNAASATLYYLENNNTAGNVSVGADGRTNYTPSGSTFTVIPYKNLWDIGPMGTQANVRYTTTVTTQVEVFRFYLPFNYTASTVISANTNANISWRAVSTSDTINVSLVDYDPVNGAKTVIGSTQFTAPIAGGTTFYQPITIPNSQYTVPSGHRLMLRINTTTPTLGTVRLYLNDTRTNITIIEGSSSTTYNLSGYIKNQSSGLPLNGATVQTNTSQTTTTNSQGYYSFSSLSNGTYNITANLSNYYSNFTIRTVNGANITNANITLSPILTQPTYLLSGYVTNQTSGAALSGATVITNTSQTTTTNGSGYYNFTLNNGTYLITASRAGYNDNSITRTVNGAAVSNANISLTPVPPAPPQTGGKILVATNRYVILDDWRTGGATGPGFSNPIGNHGTDSFTGMNTKINATALFIDNTGSPLIGRTITFNLYMPNNTELVAARVNATTNGYGLANFSYDMNLRNYYGNWTVRASNGSSNDSTGFIYNWWGCGISSGCNSGHSNSNPSGSQPRNSPYLNGRESPSWSGNHDNTLCTNCHQSFDGRPGANTTGGANHGTNANDVHRNISCDNANCHQSVTTHNTNARIGSCYNSTCHTPAGTPANRSDITNKSTLNSTGFSLYSVNNGSLFNNTFHTPGSTVPCFTCHGPMHNITKPDESLRFIKNAETESSHCTTCHSSYTKHNASNITSGGVNCTLCHSDDVHVIKVFSQNASYVTGKTNPARGNCTNCHQNATFLGLLKNTSRNPKAGNYSGNASQVQKILNHSNDPLAGQKWNDYWTAGDQYSACVYCHGSTQHDTTALGRPSQFKGTNTVRSQISNSTLTYWCSSCHWQGYTSGANTYQDMVNVFISLIVPPEITGHSTYGANQSKPDYTNHSSYAKDDATCQGCHGGLTSSTNITGLLHNVDQGSSGGPDCKSCHDIGGSAPKEIDINVLKNSTHKNLNAALSDVNLACYACHGDGTAPASGHPLNYKNPKLCENCHTGSGDYSAPLVAEHNQNGQQIITSATCNTCHDNTGMFLSNAGTNGMTTAFVHYIKDVTNRSTSPYGHFGPMNTSNCITCHRNATYTNNASWGSPVNISTSSKRIHTETLTSQC